MKFKQSNNRYLSISQAIDIYLSVHSMEMFYPYGERATVSKYVSIIDRRLVFVLLIQSNIQSLVFAYLASDLLIFQ